MSDELPDEPDELPTPAEMYLDLLKEAVLGTLYRDPPLDPWNGVVKDHEGRVVEFGKAPGTFYIEPGAYDAKKRDNGLDWPATAHTMIGRRRLDQLQFACEAVLTMGIPGDFVETGVWRGGACIFMKGLLRARDDAARRRVFVCDSFEGLPLPNAEKYPADKDDYHHAVGALLAVDEATVRDNFQRYGLLDERVVFVKGWFKDTLPKLATERIAVLRCDGDMYESTWDALTALYDRVSTHGFIIIDDYNAVAGCKEAVETFRKERGISVPLVVDYAGGAYWRKP